MDPAKNDRAYTLLRAFINDRLEKAALAELFAVLEAVDDEQLNHAIRTILDEERSSEDLAFIHERVELLQKSIVAEIDPSQPPLTWNKWSRGGMLIGIAAMLAVVLTIGYYWLKGTASYSVADHDLASTIMPGNNKATITVNGQDFELDANRGELMLGTDSLYYGNGELLTTTGAEQTIQVKTPLGGQYQLILADGSQVWLNAGSELIYNTGFGGGNRTVHLQGEAYFEVTRNPNLPFIVETQGQQVEVLGTAFNVCAYPEEPVVKTTLERGAIVVDNVAQQLILKTNQQAILDKDAKTIATRDVQAASIVAWKDGVFDFHGMSVAECMRVIARWYQLEVVYEEEVPSVLLGGKMSKGVRLSTFLDFLEMNFGIQGAVTADRKLIITTNSK